MANNSRTVDKTRASRDGHEFHEVWAARKALQLLIPTDNLIGIAVEGPEPGDQATAAQATIEIADLVLYYGRASTFKGSDTVRIIQLKLSISGEDIDFRASHAKKTIVKFAAAYLDYKKRHSAKEVRDKLEFELITNRPIYPAFEQAIARIADGKPLSGETKKQANQFKVACGLIGKPLVEFAGKCLITGLAGSLTDTKRDLSRTLVDWSATSDAVAGVRLGTMKQMVRDKAGYTGTNRNVIRCVDVLAALGVSDIDELLPCPARLPEVGKLVEREQLAEAIALIPKLDKTLLIHADGGVGKTVFLDNLAQSLSDKHDVLFFDCFGGGAYRAANDSRHLPKRGLVHIANTLACRSLCDPLLPDNNNLESLFSTFRRRLSQCVKTLSTASEKRELILFIDAIDNAAQHASDRNEPSFPTLLIESFHHSGPVHGVKLVVSCRSYRIDMSMKDIPYTDFKLKPFSPTETETYLRDRLPGVTQTEIQVAQARSGGNARILEHLVTSNRGLLDKSETENTIKLDDLLNDRIQSALSDALDHGYKKKDIDAFLAGLSALPPPVPLEEYAGAHGMDVSAIKSFAADLAPLLERTKYGLMFRDEPTETLIREQFGFDNEALQRLAKNLLERQDSSVYAARTLPDLLQRLDDGTCLFDLAFDERFPESITSTVGKQNIRYARLKAAVLHASNKRDYNRLVHILVELSTIAAVDQRGTNYILDYPDLVIAAQDIDATRRLFETRTSWPGTRHARLAIANNLSGDLDDAFRHAVSAHDWISHYQQQDREHGMDRAGPDQLDIAAIPFCQITQNRAKNAALYMRRWKDWYSYEVSVHLFSLLEQATPVKSQSGSGLDTFLDSLTGEIGVITAALSFVEINSSRRKELIKKLSKACRKSKPIESDSCFHRERRYGFQDGLLKASAIAASMGQGSEALKIFSANKHERPHIWSFREHFSNQYVFPYLMRTALISAVKRKKLHERDILPKELANICSGLRNAGSGSEFRQKLKKRLEDRFRSSQQQSKEDGKSISYERKQEAKSYINERLESLFSLTKAFASLLGAPFNKADKAFLVLLEVWAETRKKRDHYSTAYKYDRFFQLLGSQIAMFSLWARSDLKVASVETFLKRLHEQEILGVQTLIDVVAILARRSLLHAFAGEQAMKARSLIEQGDEVTYRASLFAQLGRAIVPASSVEASVYFRAGLEQMDAIGSGDYQFTNELLLFASSLKGDELEEQDYHTLTNICELNISDEGEKFPWFAFATGLSRTSGCMGLAKLARWDDRSKISLDYTLLPYLTALINDDKIAPEDALALLRLSSPVELYSCDTADFAMALDEKSYPNNEHLINELIRQFEDNNPGIPMDSTVKTLASLAEKALGKTSDTTAYLSAAHEHFGKVRNEDNENRNYRGKSDVRFSRTMGNEKKANRTKLNKIAVRAAPNDDASMARAIGELNEMQHIYDLKGEFFATLRGKVAFSDRPQYIEIIARLENLDIYTKLDELERCKEEWGHSSAVLTELYDTLAIPLIQLHTEDFMSFEQLSGYRLKNVSDLTGVSIEKLALVLIRIFASPDWNIPASVWLGLASIISDQSKSGEGQSALSRLLNSSSAKLASNVADGQWKEGLYPSNKREEIAAGFVWRMLGSPHAADRWRAAHSVRCFAEFQRWDVIDVLVVKMGTEDAHPFQAPELPFYFLHARLWLLIVLARIAMDDPKKIAKYRDVLIQIVLDKKSPHVLMRHFAAQALLSCVERGGLKLSANEKDHIKEANVSPFPRLKKKLKEGVHNSFHHGRPKDVPKPEPEFSLDYDFEKYDVHYLSDVFGKPGWEVKDMMTEVVREYDEKITSMYDSGGREVSSRVRMGHMTSGHYSYGQQFGWHALFLAAGRLLSKHPVTEDSYEEDPWTDFLDRWLHTRKDGLWLSDGMDRPPLDTKINLLEKGEEGLVITGDKAKMLRLIGADTALQKEIVVEGSWISPDNIKVHIRSALVPPRRAKALAKQLIQEEPFLVWLPTFNEYEGEGEYLRNDKSGYVPWIVCPSVEAKLDEHDPLGGICTMRRPYFVESIVTALALETDDPFGRIWKNAAGKPLARSDAWGYESKYEDEASYSGVRLLCSDELLRNVLTIRDADLLILVKLQRHKEGFGSRSNRFSNTVAVVRIKRTLSLEFYKGAINHVHESRF